MRELSSTSSLLGQGKIRKKSGGGGERSSPFAIIGVEQGVDHTTLCGYFSSLAFVSYRKTGWIQPVGIISQLFLPAFWEYMLGLRHI